MNAYTRWYSRLLLLGGALNLLFAVPALFIPDLLINFFDIGIVVFSYVWLGNVGILLILICIFYIPAAYSPEKYIVIAWLVIFSRFSAGVYWLYVVLTYPQGSLFLSLLLVDLVLSTIQSILLHKGVPEKSPFKRENFKKILQTLTEVFFKPGRVVLLLALALAGSLLWYKLFYRHPDLQYESDIDHYKYGVIGLSSQNRMPYYVWQVLPKMFPEKLPSNGKRYRALGFLFEEGKDFPIGFARREIGFPVLEPTCSLCHTGSYRKSPGDQQQLIIAGPAHQLNLQGYQRFLFDCASDPKFTAGNILAEIRKTTKLSWFDALLYRTVIIPLTKRALLRQKKLSVWQQSRPQHGPGRTDTFNPMKIGDFGLPDDGTIGTADLPQVWNQKPRQDLWLHWDGNNNKIRQRNYAAALAVGATPRSVDPESFERITQFLLQLQPPDYPFDIDQEKASRGKILFTRECYSCHAFDGSEVGRIKPLEDVGTDENRLKSFTQATVDRFHAIKAPPFIFSAYRTTRGYSNQPMDGVWARAPYLHNGSVPTLWDLLQAPQDRPRKFYRGYDIYDSLKVGFVSSGSEAEGHFLFDTTLPGNGNSGHEYGILLNDEEKWALIEFLKTL